MIYLELGFPSSFAYCVEALGMSEGAAGRRVAAARVCRRYPNAFELVARGELHLSALCALGPQLNAQNAGDLFEACRRKTRRQVEAVLAARFPKPDVREQIRRLPARPPATLSLNQPDVANQAGIPCAEGPAADRATATDPSRPLAASGKVRPGPAPRRRELEPLSETRFGVHFTADAELRDLIERARELASHRVPQGDLAGLMKLVFAQFEQREEQRRFALGSRGATSTLTKQAREAQQRQRTSANAIATGPAASTSPGEVPPQGAARFSQRPAHSSRVRKRGRHIPARVRREVYLRDRGCCTFVSDDGRRCGARAWLEFDHIAPWAKLGPASVDNIRLRCRAHNQLHARESFGALHIAARVAARRARRADFVGV